MDPLNLIPRLTLWDRLSPLCVRGECPPAVPRDGEEVRFRLRSVDLVLAIACIPRIPQGKARVRGAGANNEPTFSGGGDPTLAHAPVAPALHPFPHADIPDPPISVSVFTCAGADEVPVAVAERKEGDVAASGREAPDFLARHRIPEMHQPVLPPGGRQLAVVAQGQGIHFA